MDKNFLIIVAEHDCNSTIGVYVINENNVTCIDTFYWSNTLFSYYYDGDKRERERFDNDVTKLVLNRSKCVENGLNNGSQIQISVLS